MSFEFVNETNICVKVYKLNDPYIRNYYEENIDNDHCRSITFTLRPDMYKADILTQYRAAIGSIKKSKIFFEKIGKKYNIHPDFEEMIIIPELTKELNVHFHGYFKCNPEKAQYFYNEFRKFCYNDEVIGRQMSFKNIDDLNDTIKTYPFKDIKELLKFPDGQKMYILHFGRELMFNS